MRYILGTVAALAVAVGIFYLAGYRVLVVMPIGAVPDGVIAIVKNAPGLRLIDSPDAICKRKFTLSLMCRGMTLAGIAKDGAIVARLPYFAFADWLAGTPETSR